MIIVLKPNATEEQAKEILSRIDNAGLKPLYMPGVERIVLGALGDERVLQQLHLDAYPLCRERQTYPNQVQNGQPRGSGARHRCSLWQCRCRR